METNEFMPPIVLTPSAPIACANIVLGHLQTIDRLTILIKRRAVHSPLDDCPIDFYGFVDDDEHFRQMKRRANKY
jgi:hypothetical protein